MEIATRRWRIVDSAHPVWRHWDGEYVVHHALSNDTHRLSDAAGRILELLAQSGELVESSLVERSGVPTENLATVLSVLAELGLVVWQ
jgi:PqqD family protein of HPr-rel-A system